MRRLLRKPPQLPKCLCQFFADRAVLRAERMLGKIRKPPVCRDEIDPCPAGRVIPGDEVRENRRMEPPEGGQNQHVRFGVRRPHHQTRKLLPASTGSAAGQSTA